jgi:hypothetical protein
MKRFFLLSLMLALSLSAQGQAFFTWTAADGDFYTGSNWDQNRIPGVNDVVIINNGGTATIAANAGNRELSSFELGELEDSDDSGHIIMNGGFFRIGESPGDSKIHIGEGNIQSTFVMNGGTILFDGPDDPTLAGSRSSAGVNENDWEVGEHGVGRFEMHGDSVFRAGDDLKISENAAGTGSVLIDGNARLSVGSGIAVSSGGTSVQELIIGGNAVVDSGNSMGAGSPDGHTDEGYLTLAIGGGNAKVVVQDSGTLNFRVLSSRQGVTEFTVKDNGQVHIFDVMAGAGGSAEERPVQEGGFRSSLSSGPETESTLLLQDNAVMTVNAENGIGISGPRGDADAGGQAIMIVRDSASFRVEQYFALGTGTQSETSDGTLELRGPDASVYIGENFNMAVDPEGVVPTTDATEQDGSPTPAKSTLSAVITSSSHGTVEVGGIARIAQGILKVSLDGYTPVGGETFTLIQGGTVEGEFRETDFSGAQLAAGLSWELEYAADKVTLKVLGGSGNGGGDNGGGVTPGVSLALSSDVPAMVDEGRIVDDTIVFNVGENNLDNWEPFSGVIGNSVFVVEANTFADDGSFSNQNYAVAFQPVGGGSNSESAAFFGDDGTPFTGQINGSRQNGNPGRVAGDRRPGATNYLVGGEASPHLYAAFQSDNRWGTGFNRLEDGRYGAVQMFSLDTSSLTPTPISPAIDAVNGRLDSGEPAGNQIGRFGGDVAVLDNGNIVVAVDDRSGIREAGNLTTAVILAPDGSVVKESWVVDPRDIWSNVTSYKGGFAIRVHEIIYFHDNDGNETGQVNIVEDVPDEIKTDVAKFDTGRGDATRLMGHINSPYVFLGGTMGLLADDGFQAEDENFLPVNVVRIAAFDSRASGSDSYAGTTVVNELNEDLGGSDASNFLPALGRVNLASDALDRVAVAYEGTLRDEFGDSIGLAQTFVRVFAFDAASGFESLTPSFFAFVNQNDIDIRTFRPTVAMTTTEILIAAKGEISSKNTPNDGPDTPTQTTFYTVFAHPAPAADPTPSVDGSTGGGTTTLAIEADGNQLTISWDGGGSLFSASAVKGPWTAVNGASSPHSVTASDAAQFYRVGQGGQTVSVVLNGAQEVPAVASGGTGSGTLTVNGPTLSIHIKYSGLGSNFAAAHIHGPAARGVNAGVLVPLSTPELHTADGNTAGTFSGTVEISAETAAAILEGRAYLNIHTSGNGTGEIRGQTMP